MSSCTDPQIDPRDLYRPESVADRRAAILDLHRERLRPRDIATALRIDLGEVLEAIRDQQA